MGERRKRKLMAFSIKSVAVKECSCRECVAHLVISNLALKAGRASHLQMKRDIWMTANKIIPFRLNRAGYFISIIFLICKYHQPLTSLLRISPPLHWYACAVSQQLAIYLAGNESIAESVISAQWWEMNGLGEQEAMRHRAQCISSATTNTDATEQRQLFWQTALEPTDVVLGA